MRLGKITALAVEDLYRRLSASGLRPPSVLPVHATLRRAMSEAHRLPIVGVNFMERERAPKNCGTSGVALNVDEVRLLVDEAAKQGAMDFAVADRPSLGLSGGSARAALVQCRPGRGRIHAREALQRQSGQGLVFVKPKSRAGHARSTLTRDTPGSPAIFRSRADARSGRRRDYWRRR